MAKMAIFLRACGLVGASFALCDRAGLIEPIMYTEVARAGTWRKVGNPDEAMAAFQRALALDPTSWPLFLDMAGLAAEQGDYGRALALVEQGLKHEPAETTLRAAGVAYRARLTGSPDDLRGLIELAPHMPNDSYRSLLIDLACAGPGLPAELVAQARNFQGR
jgi:tetratricopeptide (TPR) repeat protein